MNVYYLHTHSCLHTHACMHIVTFIYTHIFTWTYLHLCNSAIWAHWQWNNLYCNPLAFGSKFSVNYRFFSQCICCWQFIAFKFLADNDNSCLVVCVCARVCLLHWPGQAGSAPRPIDKLPKSNKKKKKEKILRKFKQCFKFKLNAENCVALHGECIKRNMCRMSMKIISKWFYIEIII